RADVAAGLAARLAERELGSSRIRAAHLVRAGRAGGTVLIDGAIRTAHVQVGVVGHASEPLCAVRLSTRQASGAVDTAADRFAHVDEGRRAAAGRDAIESRPAGPVAGRCVAGAGLLAVLPDGELVAGRIGAGGCA